MELLELGVEVTVVNRSGDMLRRFELTFDESSVDDELRRVVRIWRSLQPSTCFRIGSKLRCILPKPTSMRQPG